MKIGISNKIMNCLLIIVTLVACDGNKQNFSHMFFKKRLCDEIKFICLENQNAMNLTSEPYVITAQDKTLKMYRNIIQMLAIYYPDFWESVDDEQIKLNWIRKVDSIITKYEPRRTDAELEAMAHVCAIIGVEFENNPTFQFVVGKLKNFEFGILRVIIDYLRFEVLKKDYDESGNQYNNWSISGVRDEGMPPITRHIPDFNNEWKPYNPEEDRDYIYRRDVLKERK